MSVAIRDFAPGDLPRLALQPSQHMCLGIHRAEHTLKDGEELAALGPAWTVLEAAPSNPTGAGKADDGRVLACYGFGFQFPPADKTGGHALAWAMLAEGIGSAHVAITRFARETIAASPIDRIEAIVRAEVEAEWRWAELVGFKLVAELRRWGPDGATHLLYERVREGSFVAAPSTPTAGRETHSHPLGDTSNRAPRLEALGAR